MQCLKIARVTHVNFSLYIDNVVNFQILKIYL